MLSQLHIQTVLVSLMVIYFTIITLLNRTQSLEDIILTIFIIFSLYLVTYISNFFYIIILIEIQSFSLIILIVKSENSIFSAEAGLKYLLPSAIATGGFLIGIHMVTNCWSSNIKIDITKEGLLFFFFLLFKIGIVPFQTWIIDVIEGCSWSSLLTFILLPKLTITYILVTYSILSSSLLLYISILSILVGSIGMLNQVKINRFLGYSSINSAGWILLATQFNIQTGCSNIYYNNLPILFLIIYQISVSSLILILNSFYHTPSYFTLSNISNLPNVHKIICISLLLSISGIPPFLGFYLKYWLLNSAIANYSIYIPCIVILLSIITIFAYMRIILIINNEKNINKNYLSLLANSILLENKKSEINLTKNKNIITLPTLTLFLIFLTI